ncbi:teichoic acid D-Ala incorporation-associated protein DltX [Enterococcus faecalis]|uniref:Teichoic acid D-Ala incorporation-associated protein DltX n=1 Tax=Enterococcus faecalis TaxID=1351 RepID=A0A974S6N9_ENTFL|nr:teichoic acid D-Ala incorporation-associated protein DltX [Enterococcus faecalis]
MNDNENNFFRKILNNESLKFIGKKRYFYSFIVIALIYLYHYKNINGGTFIYNEFLRRRLYMEKK